MNLDDLLEMDRSQLAEQLRRGAPLEPGQLAGRGFRGVALALPRGLRRLAWQKFRKVFNADGRTGFNQAIVDDALDLPWTPRLRRGEPITYGPFGMRTTQEQLPWGPYRGLLLDYGAQTWRLNPMGRVLDPLVSLRGTEVLLGVSYLQLGRRQLATPTWFTLLAEGPA